MDVNVFSLIPVAVFACLFGAWIGYLIGVATVIGGPVEGEPALPAPVAVVTDDAPVTPPAFHLPVPAGRYVCVFRDTNGLVTSVRTRMALDDTLPRYHGRGPVVMYKLAHGDNHAPYTDADGRHYYDEVPA